MFVRHGSPQRAGLRIVLAAGWLISQTMFPTTAMGASSAGSPGSVRLVIRTNSGSDSFTNNPTVEQQQWMASHFWRMVVFTTYWDNRLSWYPNGLFYKDAYAIYVSDTATVTAHPDWILKDASGNFLYIQWACSGGTCTQYAADISNANFRQWWIDAASRTMAKGYKGLFIDDVNMDWRISNGAGSNVTPIDANTGQPMTLENWRLYMAQFMEQIRNNFPTSDISHNSIWYSNNTNPDAYIARQIQAADYQNVEHGFADGGITGGSGTFSLSNLLNHADYVHALGRGVTFSSVPSDVVGKEYAVANYFLVSNGFDSVGSSGGNDFWPTWWPGYDVKLGEPSGARYKWQGLWRRDFSGGITLVNEPGAAVATVTLPGSYGRIDGSVINSLTLWAKQGAVLLSTSASQPGDSIAPSVPQGFAAQILSASQVALSWSPSTDNVGVVGYELSRNGVVIAGNLTATAFTDNSVFQRGTTYTYALRAFDAARNFSSQAQISVAAGTSTVRIDAGGTRHSFVDSQGNSWHRDEFFSGGSVISSNTQGTAPIQGSTLTVLDATARQGVSGNFSYHIPVTNGSYTVTLRFAELSQTLAGQRVFNVSINGAQVLNRFDILAAAPAYTVVVRTFPATASSGFIDIAFQGVVGYGIVNGIQVVPVF